MPRPPRATRRCKEVIGLPSDQELQNLATEYLTIQRKNFPEVARQGLLPTPTAEIVAAMVEDFKQRHGGAPVDPDRLSAYRRLKLELAGAYDRYSCNNSKPSSILDQNRNNLNKAASEKRFIPWEYVYADYSVSGLKSARMGYSSYKRLLQDSNHFIETTYIDDFTRASRDELEWWRLAHLCKKLRKRLIGSSDGFDLNSAMGEVLVRMFVILSLLFVKQLREKVGRGMIRSAENGMTMGRPGLGFTRRVRLDANGKQVLNPDGSPVTELCIDPETAEVVRRIVYLYIEKLLSLHRIAQILNEENADGFNHWTERTIKKILESTSLIGVFIWNQTRKEFDLDEENYVVVQRPRSEWVHYYDQSLALISIDEWFRIRERLAQIKRRPIGERPVSQNEKYPTTLLSPTLKCGYCGRDLTLLRSTAKYKVFFCRNGCDHANNCKLSTSKSARILEQAILGFLRDNILTEEAIADLRKSANEYLAGEAAKPPANTQKLTSEIRRLNEKIDRLIDQVAEEPDKAVRNAYHKRIQMLRADLDQKLALKRKLQPLSKKDLRPIDEATLRGYLADLRQLLNQDIPVAAAAIRALSGPIKIYQGPKSDRRSNGAIWKAVFTPNLPNALLHVAQKNSYPDTLLLEYLCDRIWISEKSVEIALDYAPKYQLIAPDIKADEIAGMPPAVIQRKYGLDARGYQDSIRFADTGALPRRRNSSRKKWPKGPQRIPKYKEIAPEVARLKDKEGLSFAEISRRLNVKIAVVYQAYEYAHPEIVQKSIDERHAICRDPKRKRLHPDQVTKVQEMIRAKYQQKEIMAEVGCSRNTVSRIKRRM